MNGYAYEFNPICLEKVELLSKTGKAFSAESESDKRKILSWFSAQNRKDF